MKHLHLDFQAPEDNKTELNQTPVFLENNVLQY